MAYAGAGLPDLAGREDFLTGRESQSSATARHHKLEQPTSWTGHHTTQRWLNLPQLYLWRCTGSITSMALRKA